MKRIALTALVLLSAFVLTPLTFTACDWMEDPEIRVLKAMVADLQQQQATLREEQTKERGAWAEQITDLQKRMENMQDSLEVLVNQKAQVERDNEELLAILNKSTKQVDDMRTTIEGYEDKTLAQYEITFGNNQLYNTSRTTEVAAYVLAVAKEHDFKVKLTVEGYSTIVGDAKHNKWLSKERAEGVFHKIMSVADGDAVKLDHTHVIAHGEESDNERKVVITLEVL